MVNPWVPSGSAQQWPRRNEGPASVATLNPSTTRTKWALRDFQHSSETQIPQPRAHKRGLGRKGRGRAENLPHQGSIRAPPLSRPVAPQSASYREVVAYPRRRESCSDLGQEGRRGGVGAREQRGEPAGVGAEPRGQSGPDAPRRGRAAASVQCVRAAASVCPRSPLPSPPVVRPDGTASGRQSPSRSGRLRCPAQPGRGALGGRGSVSSGDPGLGAGALRARVGARCRESGLRGRCRGSGRLQAPPAGRPGSSPFLSTPSLHPRTPCREARPDRSGCEGLRRSRTGLPCRCFRTRRSVPRSRA